MGAGASTEADKEGLRAVFAAYTAAVENAATDNKHHGSSSNSSIASSSNYEDVSSQAVSTTDFAAMVQEASPTLATRLQQAASASSSSSSTGHSHSGASSGNGSSSNTANLEAFAALRDQLDSAARKMGKVGFGVQVGNKPNISNNGSSSSRNGAGGSGNSGDALQNNSHKNDSRYGSAIVAAELKERHPAWAGEGMEGNLQRGLIAGLLRTAHLPTVRICLANGIASPSRSSNDGDTYSKQPKQDSNSDIADPLLGPLNLLPGRRAKVTIIAFWATRVALCLRRGI